MGGKYGQQESCMEMLASFLVNFVIHILIDRWIVAAFTLLVWDFFITLEDEVTYVWKYVFCCHHVNLKI